jgi:hypothetical protein
MFKSLFKSGGFGAALVVLVFSSPTFANAGSWSPPQTLATSGLQLVSLQEVFPSSDGSSVVVWKVRRDVSLPGFRYFAARINRPGISRAVSGLPTSCCFQIFAGNSSGEVVSAGPLTSGNTNQIFVQRLGPSSTAFGAGVPVWSPEDLLLPGNGEGLPSIGSLSMDSTGVARLSYLRTDSELWEFSQRPFGADGAGPESALATFEPDSNGFFSQSATVDVNDFTYFVNRGFNNIEGMTVDANGNGGPIQAIASASEFQSIYLPSFRIDAGPSGSAMASWLAFEDGGTKKAIRTAAFSGGGGVTVANSSSPADLVEAELVVGSDGGAHLFWGARDGDESTDWTLRSRSVSPAGELGSVQQLATGYETEPTRVSAAALSDGTIALAYTTPDDDLVFRLMNPDGTLSGPATVLGQGGGAKIAADADGFVSVSWVTYDQSTDTLEVLFRRYEPVDVRPPATRIVSGPPARTKRTNASFRQSSSEAGSTFRCKLDSKPYRTCGSTVTYRGVRKGRHTFKVYAVDGAGLADSTPAQRVWTVKRR